MSGSVSREEAFPDVFLSRRFVSDREPLPAGRRGIDGP